MPFHLVRSCGLTYLNDYLVYLLNVFGEVFYFYLTLRMIKNEIIILIVMIIIHA